MPRPKKSENITILETKIKYPKKIAILTMPSIIIIKE